VHHKVNNITLQTLDCIYIKGSSAIDIITASRGLLDFIEGYKLLEFNKIVLSNYRF